MSDDEKDTDYTPENSATTQPPSKLREDDEETEQADAEEDADE